MNADVAPLTPDRNPAVEAAAMWLAEQDYQSRPVPLLRERFNLSVAESCRAIGIANRMRTLRKAFA
jgi:hypothetical protein